MRSGAAAVAAHEAVGGERELVGTGPEAGPLGLPLAERPHRAAEATQGRGCLDERSHVAGIDLATGGAEPPRR